MMREPWFWRSRSLAARAAAALLAPAAAAYQAGQSLRRAATIPAKASIPVICIGNATLGGAGKTPFAMLVAEMLREQDVAASFLTRGYGGGLAGPVAVDPDRHDADDVGDEALLLARRAPTIVSRNRPQGARLAAANGAQAIVMDDGFQNPTLLKDLSILLIGPDEAQSNGALFPAGPYRETLGGARARAGIVVAMGENKGDADFRAWLEPVAPAPERIVAFAGIGHPEKFFATLEQAGYEIARRVAFPDHHRFSEAELRLLERNAARDKARLICTEKDHVRLPADLRARVLALAVVMRVNDPDGLKRRLAASITGAMPATPRDPS